MTDVIYRDATVDDAAMVAELGRATFVETFAHLYRDEDLQAFLAKAYGAGVRTELADPAYACRLGFAGEAPIAYCKVGPLSVPVDPGARRAVELRQLYVLGSHQGRGVAPALMDWALGQARARRAQDVYLSVYSDNHRAKRFYTRYGFIEIGRYDFRVGSQVDDERILRLQLED